MPHCPTSLGLAAFDAQRLSVLALDRDGTYVLFVLLTALAVVAVLLVILLRLSNSLRQLRASARRLAQSDLSQRVDVKGPLRITELAATLNEMADQLQERLHTLTDQRNEFGAVLSSMAEGVITFDLQERMTSINPAGAMLLQCDAIASLGRTIQETLRHPSLQRIVQQLILDQTRVDATIELLGSDQPGDGYKSRHLQVHGSVLRRGDGQVTGVLLVLHDVTRIKRLEAVRRDFVANVSHELKTPVATIKAAAETLADLGADEWETSQRFVSIVARQADRMQAIIDDLLTLAKLEQEGGDHRIPLERHEVARLLRAAVDNCQPAADAKRIRMQVLCEPDLIAHAHGPMLEQAVVNLLDNAIKYGPEGSEVMVSGRQDGAEVVLAVEDHGSGIEARDHHRLFERFYRTDRARSRAMGGTGLGLAIVKHIVQAHGGRVSVKSRPGAGSTFSLHLPRVRTPSQTVPSPRP